MYGCIDGWKNLWKDGLMDGREYVVWCVMCVWVGMDEWVGLRRMGGWVD
jgi:hypothetical protein